MAAAEADTTKKEEREGNNLMGSPTFTELPNGRLKCVETGHELTLKDKDSYSHSKRCRLGLIDFALAHNKPPLNMFKQDPLSRSKLICKLTGDTVNKNEEHIWKHINGRRFLNKLEQKESATLDSEEMVEEQIEEKQPGKSTLVMNGEKTKKNKKKKNKGKKEKQVEEIISEVRNSTDEDSDSEDIDFWVPPTGDRWDFDDGGDRWGPDVDSEDEEENGTDEAVEDNVRESEELSKRAKRMSIEIGPSSFASRKKKSKKN